MSYTCTCAHTKRWSDYYCIGLLYFGFIVSWFHFFFLLYSYFISFLYFDNIFSWFSFLFCILISFLYFILILYLSCILKPFSYAAFWFHFLLISFLSCILISYLFCIYCSLIHFSPEFEIYSCILISFFYHSVTESGVRTVKQRC